MNESLSLVSVLIRLLQYMKMMAARTARTPMVVPTAVPTTDRDLWTEFRLDCEEGNGDTVEEDEVEVMAEAAAEVEVEVMFGRGSVSLTYA
jgi:hypothetical protein